LIEDYAHYRRGEAAGITSAVKEVTGEAPRSFRKFARDHQAAFLQTERTANPTRSHAQAEWSRNGDNRSPSGIVPLYAMSREKRARYPEFPVRCPGQLRECAFR
jgi:hypothetical protein